MEGTQEKARWVGWKGPESKIIFSSLSLLPLKLSPDPTYPRTDPATASVNFLSVALLTYHLPYIC
jgi:hypothetical protein